MKKFFLIPLLTLVCSVMAFATVRTAGTYAELKSALSAAQDGDEIQLTADIAYTSNNSTVVANLLNIKKSITLDGQGHTISGYWKKSSNNVLTLAINYQGEEMIDVTLRNLTITNNAANCSSIITFGNLTSLTLENCQLIQQHKTRPFGIFFIGNHQETPANVTINNSTITHSNAQDNGNPLMVNVPINLVMNNSTTQGWRAIYFKFGRTHEGYVCDGARGTVVTANSCLFNGINNHEGHQNGSSTFFCEDDGITLNLHNCGLCAEQPKQTSSAMYVLGVQNTIPTNRRTQDVELNISGDNSYINGSLIISNIYTFRSIMTDDPNNPNFSKYAQNTYYLQNGNYYKKSTETPYANDPEAAFDVTMDVRINISGGTFSYDPTTVKIWKAADTYNPTTGKVATAYVGYPKIPAGYELKTMTTTKNRETLTVYRIREAISEGAALNDNAGQNEDKNIQVTTDVTLANTETKAEYIEVKGSTSSAPEDKVTVTVPEGKTLDVSNGMDVTGNAQVVVEPGSTISVGEGGLITESPENIVIQADENGAASLLLDPAVVVNTTPNLTVKMLAKQIGWVNVLGEKSYFWHRFALPIQEANTWVKNPNKSTYVFGWNYAANNWEQLSALNQMVPFKGYTLTADYEDLGNVEYTFTGELAGNTNNMLEFERNGFNFFGNSYTGYIDVLALVDQLMGDHKIDATVWMWYQEEQSYVAVPLRALRDNPGAFDSWMREVAPMQTFILKQNGAENAATELNYASAIWGNPRYGKTSSNTSSPAPRRAEADETTCMRIIVKAENGKSDFVMLTEDAKYSDAFEKGYDGEKYMNENKLNLYTTINNANYTVVATDRIEGKSVTLKTLEAVNYTMSFAKVNGEEYAILDKETGKVTAIKEGNTYEFAAQPNSTVEGRFEILPIANAPTAIENTEVKANVKGIYTIMGQYVGENFDILPTGVYVVNGVKIVK